MLLLRLYDGSCHVLVSRSMTPCLDRRRNQIRALRAAQGHGGQPGRADSDKVLGGLRARGLPSAVHPLPALLVHYRRHPRCVSLSSAADIRDPVGSNRSGSLCLDHAPDSASWAADCMTSLDDQ